MTADNLNQSSRSLKEIQTLGNMAYFLIATSSILLTITTHIFETYVMDIYVATLLLAFVAVVGMFLSVLFPLSRERIFLPMAAFALLLLMLLGYIFAIRKLVIAWHKAAEVLSGEVFFPQAFMLILLTLPFLTFSWMLASSMRRSILFVHGLDRPFCYVYYVLHYDIIEHGEYRKARTSSPIRSAIWGYVGGFVLFIVSGIFGANGNSDLFANWATGEERTSSFAAVMRFLYQGSYFDFTLFLIPIFAIFFFIVEIVVEYRTWVDELDEEKFDAIKREFCKEEDSTQ